MSDLNLDQELVILNNETSLGSELLLTVEIDDLLCSTFPNLIDNDFCEPDLNHPESTSPFLFLTCSMNIFIEKDCKLSYEDDVCTNFDKELATSLTLDALTLTDILTVKERRVYNLIGLQFDSTNHPSTVINDDAKIDLLSDKKKYSCWVPVGASRCRSPQVSLRFDNI